MGQGYLSYAATVVLQAVAGGCAYGFDIMDVTGLPGGSVYPALRRLEEAGLLSSRWEKAAIAQREMRPPRKYYALTRSGDEALAAAIKRYRLIGASHALRAQKPSRQQG